MFDTWHVYVIKKNLFNANELQKKITKNHKELLHILLATLI